MFPVLYKQKRVFRICIPQQQCVTRVLPLMHSFVTTSPVSCHMYWGIEWGLTALKCPSAHLWGGVRTQLWCRQHQHMRVVGGQERGPPSTAPCLRSCLSAAPAASGSLRPQWLPTSSAKQVTLLDTGSDRTWPSYSSWATRKVGDQMSSCLW